MSITSIVPQAESLAAAGTAVAPANGAAIVTIAAPPAGEYLVMVKAGYGGTADVVNGMELRKGATAITTLAMLAIANSLHDHVLTRVTLDGASALTVNARQVGAVGSVYIAEIVAVRIQ